MSTIKGQGPELSVAGPALPERFGPWQTVWKRHARFSKDGTWDQIMAALLTTADHAGHVDWQLSIDSTISLTFLERFSTQCDADWLSVKRFAAWLS